MFAQVSSIALRVQGRSSAVSLPWFSPGSEAGGGAGSRNWIQIC